MPLRVPVATAHSIAEEPANEKGTVSATGVPRGSAVRPGLAQRG